MHALSTERCRAASCCACHTRYDDIFPRIELLTQRAIALRGKKYRLLYHMFPVLEYVRSPRTCKHEHMVPSLHSIVAARQDMIYICKGSMVGQAIYSMKASYAEMYLCAVPVWVRVDDHIHCSMVPEARDPACKPQVCCRHSQRWRFRVNLHNIQANHLLVSSKPFLPRR